MLNPGAADDCGLSRRRPLALERGGTPAAVRLHLSEPGLPAAAR